MSTGMPATVEAAALSVYGCEVCGLVSESRSGVPRCPRCGHGLAHRRARSLEATAAYLAAAVILYIPANVLPVMTTKSIIGDSPHTILGGIIELWDSKSWELAVIVFIASILVPMIKVASLALLAFTAQRKSTWRQQERSRLYRLVETVGHWSMLDVFVVVLLVGMVRFGTFAGVRPEPGLLAFGAVVVLTMLASSSFDPRLIWPSDAVDAKKARE